MEMNACFIKIHQILMDLRLVKYCGAIAMAKNDVFCLYHKTYHRISIKLRLNIIYAIIEHMLDFQSRMIDIQYKNTANIFAMALLNAARILRFAYIFRHWKHQSAQA